MRTWPTPSSGSGTSCQRRLPPSMTMPFMNPPRCALRALPGHPHLETAVVQVALEPADAVIAVVDHRRHQRGIGLALREHVVEMLGPPRAAGRDDGDAHGLG